MSQENSGDEMRPEYDIRGGVRGKYFRQHVEAKLQVEESTWIRQPSTISRGDHPRESTIRIGDRQLYPVPRIEVGLPAAH